MTLIIRMKKTLVPCFSGNYETGRDRCAKLRGGSMILQALVKYYENLENKENCPGRDGVRRKFLMELIYP